MIQKAKVLTLIVFGLLFINLSAQGDEFSNDPTAKLSDDDRKIRFGLQFSPNVSWLKANTTGYESTGTKMGFSYGLSFEYFLSKNYLFSTGLIFLQTGGTISYKGVASIYPDIYPADTKVTYNLRYIEIPMMLKLRTNEIGYLTYFGQFGFKMGFNHKANAEFEYHYIDPDNVIPENATQTTANSTEDVNFLNLNLSIGGGIEYNISGNTSLMLGITYNNGFINQLDTKVSALDANGDAVIDSFGKVPVYTDKDASANLNYVALNIGIYF